jgi:glycolate oxidase iron-sulfur subunit
MKDYGRLLGTPGAVAFSARVRDFSEWVVEQGPVPVRNTHTAVVVQDPCHLRHVQRAHGAVRTVLGSAYALAETDDDGLCCGAGGAYAALQPDMAASIRDRKAEALRRAAPGPRAVVASANPGCMLHLRQAGLDVRHPADLLAAALEDEHADGR